MALPTLSFVKSPWSPKYKLHESRENIHLWSNVYTRSRDHHINVMGYFVCYSFYSYWVANCQWRTENLDLHMLGTSVL
jgi:hypothetical protein